MVALPCWCLFRWDWNNGLSLNMLQISSAHIGTLALQPRFFYPSALSGHFRRCNWDFYRFLTFITSVVKGKTQESASTYPTVPLLYVPKQWNSSKLTNGSLKIRLFFDYLSINLDLFKVIIYFLPWGNHNFLPSFGEYVLTNHLVQI